MTREHEAAQLKHRFDPKYQIVESGGCWVWMGSISYLGYGHIRGVNSRTGVDSMLKAHRVSWELHRGRIPDGLFVLHHCDNPPCVNPDHLFLGTHQDNMNDMAAKGRACSGENHPLSKISNAQADEIRAIGKTLSLRKIAGMFGVSTQLVSDIILGKRRNAEKDQNNAKA